MYAIFSCLGNINGGNEDPIEYMGNVYIWCGVQLYCTQTWMSSNALCECKRSSFLRSLKTDLPVNNPSLRLQKTGSNNFRICSCCHIIDYDLGEVADEKGDVG